MSARLHLPPNSRPRLPDGICIYALSDIHGCADLLRQMFTVIDADLARGRATRAIHVFLGDYIDRGPDSRGTIDLLVERAERHECVFLKGNHEYLMLQMLNDPARYHEWKQFGGLQTLMSYGIQPVLNPTAAERTAIVDQLLDALPDRHRNFLRLLKSSYCCGDFFFVHAGIRPGVPLDQQRDEDMLWIRDEFLGCDQDFGKYIVHGHTPARQPDIRHNRINIDTGAYATGNLTLLSIQGDSIIAI
jgi:serine/threonine protein phosphatase 1